MRFALAMVLQLVLTWAPPLLAQEQIPGFEIYLVDRNNPLVAPQNISDHPGYDNQPAFSATGEQIYYSRKDDGQTDIWLWQIAGSQRQRLTRTPESEYSPTPVPEQAALSMIRVDAEQKQLLWQLDLSDGSWRQLITDMEPVGYHCWYSPGAVALFMLPEPFKLVLYANPEEQLLVAENIGRALHRHPETGELLYVDKNQTPWKIRAFTTSREQHRYLAPLYPGGEDFTISNDGMLWTGNGAKLYRRGANDERWQLEADYSAYGIRNISRIAVSPDQRYLALVSEE